MASLLQYLIVYIYNEELLSRRYSVRSEKGKNAPCNLLMMVSDVFSCNNRG